MARRNGKIANNQAAEKSSQSNWSRLTWDDLEDWAGNRSVERGREYQRSGQVQKLVRTDDGMLLATVVGRHKYTTAVWLEKPSDGGVPNSECTCPVGESGCKHAVAVVTEYLKFLAEGNDASLADSNDKRWAKLEQHDARLTQEYGEEDEYYDDDEEDDDAFEDSDDEDDFSPIDPPRRGGRSSAASKKGGRLTHAKWDEKIAAYVSEKRPEELADLVCSLVQRFPQLRQEFQERILLTQGDAHQLVAEARKELRAVTKEAGWSNHWEGESHIPNYSPLKKRLERLLEMGHPDEVVELGKELIQRGIQQVEQSHDEGETGTAVSDCLQVVFRAVEQSNLSAPEKIFYVIDAYLRDSYDIVGEAADAVYESTGSPEDWSIVADHLRTRLTPRAHSSGERDFFRDYKRDRVTNYLSDALMKSGRENELLALFESEARVTNSYQRLVDYLIKKKRPEEAERWARDGIVRTVEKLPGIAAMLGKTLCELAAGRKQWDVVAAHVALEFFEHPCDAGFDDLIKAAYKAKCGEEIRKAILHFLETGNLPVKIITKGKEQSLQIAADWPLPIPDYLIPLWLRGRIPSQEQPRYDVLLEMALKHKQPDEVLRWYDRMYPVSQKKRRVHWESYGDYGNRVADAVAATHPERALAIYRAALDTQLQPADQNAYAAAAKSLRKMRPVLKSLGREQEWVTLVHDIRENYRRRPRFMEILDKLDDRPILESHNNRRRR